MKSYIQDLCGDEGTVVIDCAILECNLKDAIFDKLVGSMMNKETIDKTHDVIWDFLSKHQSKPSVSIGLTLKRGVNDERRTICWNVE